VCGVDVQIHGVYNVCISESRPIIKSERETVRGH
jgi:hypothetical protein